MPLDGFRPPVDDDEPSTSWLQALLAELYERQLSEGPNDYLEQHGDASYVRSQVDVFRWYWPWLQSAQTVLDWGCQHGPDSALLRASSDSLELHGCDFADEQAYEVFRRHSRAEYRRLTSSFDLPYEDGQFDAVVASGVLEHVPSDLRSLIELHRILRPGGRLVVAFLPNALSLDEWKLRRKPNSTADHERLYTRRLARTMLRHSGFRPLTPILYQTPAWQRQAERVFGRGAMADRAASGLRVVAPLHVVRASTLCFIAERVAAFR